MTDLPDTPVPVSPPAAATATPTGNKELVGGVDAPEMTSGSTPELGIPKEVAAAGVRVNPTSIPIPVPVAKLGVTPAGNNVLPPQVPATALPISDEQIAKGLKKDITSSWLWLANWCVKRLKQLHIGLQSIGGKMIRVKV